VIDLSALLQETVSLNAVPCTLLLSERAAIGMALERTLATWQLSGQISGTSRPEPDALGGRTDVRIARLTSLGGKTRYRHAKIVFTQGIPGLVSAMDKQQLSVQYAAQVASTSPDQQRVVLADHLHDFSTTPLNQEKQ